jgi:hypothetical protein
LEKSFARRVSDVELRFYGHCAAIAVREYDVCSVVRGKDFSSFVSTSPSSPSASMGALSQILLETQMRWLLTTG